MYKWILPIGFLLLGCDNIQQTWEPAETALFENRAFVVAPGDSLLIGRIAFGATGGTRNHELAGSFTSSAPTRLIILPQLELVEFQSGREYEATWDSGLTTSGAWDFEAEPNGYNFVVDNRGVSSEVTVTATIRFRQEELVDVRRL